MLCRQPHLRPPYSCRTQRFNLSPQEEGSAAPSALPLAAEAWADDLLSRIFAVLTNLEAPDHRASDQVRR